MQTVQLQTVEIVFWTVCHTGKQTEQTPLAVIYMLLVQKDTAEKKKMATLSVSDVHELQNFPRALESYNWIRCL